MHTSQPKLHACRLFCCLRQEILNKTHTRILIQLPQLCHSQFTKISTAVLSCSSICTGFDEMTRQTDSQVSSKRTNSPSASLVLPPTLRRLRSNATAFSQISRIFRLQWNALCYFRFFANTWAKHNIFTKRPTLSLMHSPSENFRHLPILTDIYR